VVLSTARLADKARGPNKQAKCVLGGWVATDFQHGLTEQTKCRWSLCTRPWIVWDHHPPHWMGNSWQLSFLGALHEGYTWSCFLTLSLADLHPHFPHFSKWRTFTQSLGSLWLLSLAPHILQALLSTYKSTVTTLAQATVTCFLIIATATWSSSLPLLPLDSLFTTQQAEDLFKTGQLLSAPPTKPPVDLYIP